MRAAVIGSGAWGTALALVLHENGHQVALWSYTQKESQVLREEHENPMLKGVPLPEELELTCDLSCARGRDVIVLAQASMAHMEQPVSARTGLPTLSSPRRCVEQVRQIMEGLK